MVKCVYKTFCQISHYGFFVNTRFRTRLWKIQVENWIWSINTRFDQHYVTAKVIKFALANEKFSKFSPSKNACNYCRCTKKKIRVADVWKIIVRHHHYHRQFLSLALALLITML